jgi:uncharacterized protein (DUF2141 family)
MKARFLLIAWASLAAGLAPPPQPAATRTGMIVGQVVDAATGRPIAGAVVSITGVPPAPRTAQSPAAPPQRILTGAEGVFVFRDLPAGSFGITAIKTGYSEGASGRRRPEGSSQPIVLADGEGVGDVSIRMWKHGAITGTVVDEAGEGLVGVQMRAFRRLVLAGRRQFVRAVTTLTDDRGVYRLGNLVASEYIVIAGARQVAMPVAVVQGLQRGWSVTPESGAPPMLPGLPGSVQLGSSVYALGRGAPTPAPAPGDRLFVYPLTVHPSLAAVAQGTTIAVASGEERSAVDLQLAAVPTVRISGVLLGTTAAMPLRLLPAGMEGIVLDEDVVTTLSEGSGAFTFPAVPAGQYLLRTATPNQQPSQLSSEPMGWVNMPLDVGGADIEGLTVSLQSVIRINGRLEFEGTTERPAASELERIQVAIETADGQPTARAPALPARVGGSGVFIWTGLPSGKYLVRVVHSPTGWMFKSAMVDGRDVSETPLDLQGGDISGLVIHFTDRWSGLSGTVRSTRGDGDSEATVVIFPADAEKWTNYGTNPRRVRSARTSKTGEYKITSLPPGDYLVIALQDDDAADWNDPNSLEALARIATDVTIGEGEHRIQDLHTRESK